MCLTDPKLTVALCTNHCSLAEAIKRLTPERIIYVTKMTREFLKQSGLAHRGRALAFAGINPHMGEAGLFGDEDFRVVAPAVMKLNKEGIAIVHAPADTIFHYAVNKRAFDAVICAYHDQGLIPFKLVAFETGRERDARAADHPHLAGPRHGARNRWPREGRSSQHVGRGATGLPVGPRENTQMKIGRITFNDPERSRGAQ